MDDGKLSSSSSSSQTRACFLHFSKTADSAAAATYLLVGPRISFFIIIYLIVLAIVPYYDKKEVRRPPLTVTLQWETQAHELIPAGCLHALTTPTIAVSLSPPPRTFFGLITLLRTLGQDSYLRAQILHHWTVRRNTHDL